MALPKTPDLRRNVPGWTGYHRLDGAKVWHGILVEENFFVEQPESSELDGDEDQLEAVS